MSWREWGPRLGVALGYVAVAIIFTWPLALHLGTRLTGDPGGDTGVYVWNQWVFQYETASGANPLVHPADLLPLAARRSVAAQLHRVPQSAGAAADSARRRRGRVQPGPADHDRDHRALRLPPGPGRVPDHPGRGLRRRPRVRLVAGAGGAHHRALQPGRRGAARRVLAVRDPGRTHPRHRLRRARRPVHGVGGVLRSVFRASSA